MNIRKIELTEAFSPEGIAKLSVGQTLTFDRGVEVHYKITKIKNGRIWAKEITLYRPEEFTINDRRKPSDKAKWVDKVTKK